jgi:hypothetical protein
MIGNQFSRNGSNLMYTTPDFRVAVSDVQWRKLKVSDDKQDLIWYHGTLTWPTYARGRTIIIEWLLIAPTRAQLSKGMDWLDTLFALQWVPTTVETKEFKILDEQQREWVIQCKVDQPIDYEIEDDNDHNDGAMRRWRVALFASDPRFYSTVASVFSGQEWNYWWFALPNTLWNTWNMAYNAIDCLSTSNVDQPIKITITVWGAIHKPLSIYNLTAHSWFMLDIDADAGDIIVIDAKNQKATRNGQNIVWYRVPGSQRPTVKGLTKYVMYDVDGGIYGSDFDITLSFNNSLL